MERPGTAAVPGPPGCIRRNGRAAHSPVFWQDGTGSEQQIRFALDAGAVGALDAAGLEHFGRLGVAGDDPVELILGGPQVIADDLAEDGPVVHRAFEVAFLDLEHRTRLAGLPRHRIRGAAAEDGGSAGAGVVSLDPAAGDEHDRGFGMIGSVVVVLDAGPSELGEGDDDQIVPAALVRILEEVFPETVQGPTDALLNPASKSKFLLCKRARIFLLFSDSERIFSFY